MRQLSSFPESQAGPALEQHPEHPLSGTAPARQRRPAPRLRGCLTTTLLGGGGLAVFILALRLLGKGAGSIGPLIVGGLRIRGPINTLGFGWLFAYVVLSGTPVVSVALTFFASGVLTPVQTLFMISGGRLGADMIVFFVGFLYFLRGHDKATSISLGVVAQTVTATTYLPALPLGYWLLRRHLLDRVRIGLPPAIGSTIEVVFDPIVRLIAAVLPAWLVFILGVGAILAAFRLLDHALPEVHAEHRAFGRIGHLVYRPVAMFALGMLITLIGMSVSVSISLLVPLTARGLIRRDNTVPYIIGANFATLVDKLVPALLINNPLAVTIILVEMASIAVVSLIILLFVYRPYERMVLRLLDRVIASNRALAVFLGVMIAVPLTLLLI